MARDRFSLETLEIASPCGVPWEHMPGDDRTRFCPQCRKHVYNLAALSRAEAEDLLRRTEGRLCVRLFRRADGTVLTSDCPIGLRTLRRRLAWATAGAVVLFLAFFGRALGIPNPGRGQVGGSLREQLPRPVQVVLDWLDPPERTATMGAVCPVPPPAPAAAPGGANGQQPTPPADPM
jgi:hypothetical protein